ncbi:MAG TPA: cytochrome c oxidase subunit II [Dehalococcoidia bacterium]|nr:cytochrome c oxidase subunit II [Dehalococcoidia bacterium]
MHFTRRFARRALLALPLLALAAAACSAPQTTTDPQSDFADAVQNVYLIVTILAMIVFVAIMVLVVVIAVSFRERPGREARQFHSNTRLEIVWTIIPVAIVAIIAVPTFFAIADTTDPPPAGAVKIELTGHQWWFEFDYTELGLVTANEIHIPAGVPVSFNLISDDVIHSFWVPQLAGKVDLLPGHENNLWFTPHLTAARDEAYLGQCAEFCGLAHANMRFRVFVDTPADFDAWVAAQKADQAPTTNAAATAGEQLFLASACVSCHSVQGTTAAGVVGPNLSHLATRETIAAGIMPNDRESLIRWISNPDEEKPGVVLMPAFEDSMTQEQIASLADYLLSLQ